MTRVTKKAKCSSENEHPSKRLKLDFEEIPESEYAEAVSAIGIECTKSHVKRNQVRIKDLMEKHRFLMKSFHP